MLSHYAKLREAYRLSLEAQAMREALTPQETPAERKARWAQAETMYTALKIPLAVFVKFEEEGP